MTTRTDFRAFVQALLDASPGTPVQAGDYEIGRPVFRRVTAYLLGLGILRRGRYSVIVRTDMHVSVLLATLVQTELHLRKPQIEYRVRSYNFKKKRHEERTFVYTHPQGRKAFIRHCAYLRERWFYVRGHNPQSLAVSPHPGTASRSFPDRPAACPVTLDIFLPQGAGSRSG